MAHASLSPGGKLKTLEDKCGISIGGQVIQLKILPEITDTKRASYADVPIIGRSSPIKTYSHSENRSINMRLHFMAVEKSDLQANRDAVYLLESATYPREGDPYRPPPVCKISCGELCGKQPLCCVLDSYTVQPPTNVVWDPNTLMPYYFSVSTTWTVVYASSSGQQGLPNQDRILSSGV